jgi:hypothetical protein
MLCNLKIFLESAMPYFRIATSPEMLLYFVLSEIVINQQRLPLDIDPNITVRT